MMLRLFSTIVILLAWQGYSHAQEWKKWQSKHGRDHPLVGKTVAVDGEPIDHDGKEQKTLQQRLESAAKAAKYVLIGENHDNPDHHKIQAWLINKIAHATRKPSVVFEMVPRSYADKLNQYDLTTDPELNAFAIRLDWEDRGWYSWGIYRPVALAAARNGLPMMAGNLDRKRVQDIAKKGKTALTASEIDEFGLTTDLARQHQTTLSRELMASHCDLLPASALPAMALVQRARDGSMTSAMIKSGAEHGSVLIAGNGHVRKDRGVPLTLRAKQSHLHNKPDILVVGLIEIKPDAKNPADYELRNNLGTPLYDYVIFTPKFDVTDHCAVMREQFRKMKKDKP